MKRNAQNLVRPNTIVPAMVTNSGIFAPSTQYLMNRNMHFTANQRRNKDRAQKNKVTFHIEANK